MNLYYFEKQIYKGNIKRDFYFYCARKNKKLYLYSVLYILFWFLSLFSNKIQAKFNKNYYKILNTFEVNGI